MALGEAIKQDFKIIKNNPSGELIELDLPKTNVADCCFNIPVLAKSTGGDNYTNDKSSVLWFYDNGFTTAVLNLQRCDNGTWTEVANLNDNTYGVFYPFGFEVNKKQESLLGYLIDWQLVLTLLGAGTYRVQTEETTVLGDTVNRFSLEWELKEYTQNRADLTTRIDWYNAGIIGSLTDDKDTRDYGDLEWFNQIRLPDTVFGNDSSTYEREFVRYQNGNQVWLQDDSIEAYVMSTGRFPNYLHRLVKYDVLQAERILITNYDTDAPVSHTDKEVVPNSNYEPNYTRGTKLSSVEVTFEQAYQNHRKKRC